MRVYVYEIKTHDPKTGKFEAEQVSYSAPDAATAQGELMEHLRNVTAGGRTIINVELTDAYIL